MNSYKNKTNNKNHNKTVKRDLTKYMGLDKYVFTPSNIYNRDLPVNELLQDASQNCNLFQQSINDIILISSIINTTHIDSDFSLQTTGPQQPYESSREHIGYQITGEHTIKTNGPIFKNKPTIFDYSSIKLSKGVWFVESSILLSSFEPGTILSLESLSMASQTINDKNCTNSVVTFINSYQYINKISGIFVVESDTIIYVVLSLYNLDGNIKVITRERNPNMTATRIA